MPARKEPAVYVLATHRHGTLYIGVTSNLRKRVWQHKNHLLSGFTGRYAVYRLVYYELHAAMLGAIQREKQLKNWKREWKIELIERSNPDWRDLYGDVI